MKRMSSGPTLAYVFMGGLAIGTIPGMLLVAFCFGAATMQPDREPRIIGLLYDLGMLSFQGSLGLFQHRLSRVCDRRPGRQEQHIPQMACLPDDLADRHRGHSDPDVAPDVGSIRLERVYRVLARCRRLRSLARTAASDGEEGHRGTPCRRSAAGLTRGTAMTESTSSATSSPRAAGHHGEAATCRATATCG